MAGPWEQYQQAAPAAAGPWSNYQSGGIPTGPRKTGTIVDQIPGYDGPVPAATAPIIPDRKLGMLENVAALPLTAATAVTSGPASIAGMWGEALLGKEAGGKISRALTFPTYTEAQRQQLGSLSRGLEAAHLPPTLGGAGIPLNAMAGPAMSQTVNALGKGVDVAITQPMARRADRIAQEQSAKAWQRAPQIEAAQKAPKYGVALNPARSNPTVVTKTGVGAVGESGVNYELSQKNLPKWNEAARKDLGLPENTPLDETALSKYMERNSTSDLVIDKMGVLGDTKSSLDELKNLLLDERRTSDKAKFTAVNEVVNRAREQVAEGLTGSEVMDQIRGLRHDAKVILRQVDAGPDKTEVALTKLKIANAFENLIENNLTDKSVIDLYRKERTAKAKGFDWERAIDPITKQVDPNQLAADVRNGVKMTGVLADLAQIAGAYPEIASMRPLATPDLYTNLRRGGAGGTIGFSTIGGPSGAAIGAGITSIAGRIAAKGMAKPSVQQKYAIPQDTRLPLSPVEGMIRPDFVMQGGTYSPMPPAAPITAPNRLLGAPSAEGTMGSLAADRARANRMAYSLAENAEAQAAAAEVAANMGKRTTNRSMNLEWDPVAQVYREAAPQGAGGVIGSLTPLESAVQKMSGQVLPETSGTIYTTTRVTPKTGAEPYTRVTRKGGETSFERQGQAFAMTAEEKIAWNKAKADLAQVMPGMKSLPDEAIAAKMMDRDFAVQAVANARAKADALAKQEAALAEQLANRNNLRLMAREIEAKNKELARIQAERQSLMDLAEQMDEGLRAPRPVSSGGQGPKTRAHQRNKLNMLSDQEALNKLLEK